MALWIPITIFAAFAQNLRFMLQKHLKDTRLSTVGATLSRFLYSAPLVAILVFVYAQAADQALPQTTPRFWGFAALGGLAQILATLCVVALFAQRNFATGITFKKTEVLQTALVGFLILGEPVSWGAAVAIGVGFVAILLLSEGVGSLAAFGAGLWNRATALGLMSGVLFALSAVSYRGASTSLGLDDYFLRAAFTLSVVTAGQALAMLAWLGLFDRPEIVRVLQSWRVAGLVGVASMFGSLGWFTAFTLQNAAYVKALGQIELLFSFAASVLVFKETPSGREILAMILLSVSILLLVLLH